MHKLEFPKTWLWVAPGERPKWKLRMSAWPTQKATSDGHEVAQTVLRKTLTMALSALLALAKQKKAFLRRVVLISSNSSAAFPWPESQRSGQVAGNNFSGEKQCWTIL